MHDPGLSIWRCRDCDACELARRVQRRAYFAQVARCGLARVPSGPAADVVEGWVTEGFSPRVIAAAAGFSARPLYQLADRAQPSADRDLAMAVLGVSREGLYGAVRGRELVPAIGVRRRLEGLAWAGWDVEALGVMSGPAWRRVVDPPLVPAARRRRVPVRRYQRQVQAGTYWAVEAAFRDLSLRRGPSDRYAALARERRWAPPLAWDLDCVDDPLARPEGVGGRRVRGEVDPVAVDLLCDGYPPPWTTAAEREAAVAVLVGRGLGSGDIGRRMGLDARSVERIRAGSRGPAIAA